MDVFLFLAIPLTLLISQFLLLSFLTMTGRILPVPSVCYFYGSRGLRPGKEQPLPNLEEHFYWPPRHLFKTEIALAQHRRKVASRREQLLERVMGRKLNIIFLCCHTHAIMKSFFFTFYIVHFSALRNTEINTILIVNENTTSSSLACSIQANSSKIWLELSL